MSSNRQGVESAVARPVLCWSGWASVATLLVLALVDGVAPALANGGKIQVAGQRAGPYEVTVFTDPTPIRVGVVDVSVAVQKAGTDDVVRGAQVAVTAAPIGHAGGGGTFAATHELATNKLFYAADVHLPAAGRWRIEVAVAGELGEGKVAFEVTAEEASLFEDPVALALLALPPLALAAWWFSRSRRESAK
jgi:hypothetical protein